MNKDQPLTIKPLKPNNASQFRIIRKPINTTSQGFGIEEATRMYSFRRRFLRHHFDI